MAVLLLAGCASAVPGYSPPSQRSSKFQAMEGGTMVEGRYQLSEYEKNLDCRRLAGSMHIIIARLRDARDRARPSALATGAHKTVPIFTGGSSVGADPQDTMARERARLAAYNRELAAKNCATVDIEAELAKPPEPMGKKY